LTLLDRRSWLLISLNPEIRERRQRRRPSRSIHQQATAGPDGSDAVNLMP
jgi:hypothetical protein